MDLAGKVVGLLDNTKEQGDVILQTIGDALRERHGVALVRLERRLVGPVRRRDVGQVPDGRDLPWLRARREELVQKRDELVSRAKMAQAQQQVQTSLKSVSVMDPTGELTRFEEKVRRQEAMVRGMEEVAASSLDEQFASLESADDELEVDARLAQLKGGV